MLLFPKLEFTIFLYNHLLNEIIDQCWKGTIWLDSSLCNKAWLWGEKINKWKILLLYSWRFSHYSAPIHWLVHGHMTSNNETVSRQMPWAGNIAKAVTLNGKQFTVTREMLTAVSRDQRWPDVVAGIWARFSKLPFVLFCYMANHLMTGPLGNSEFCFPRISMFPSTSSRETLRLSETKFTVLLGTSH